MNISKFATVSSIVLIWLSCTACAGAPANKGSWNGHKSAVSLSYDDALNVHLDIVVPALNAHNLRGTFYIPGSFAPLGARIDDWRTAASQGHELGNHTLFHPCIGQGPGRDWVDPQKDLSQWSFERYTENLAANSVLLSAIDGKKLRTFAYPCGDTTVGGKSYVPFIAQNFSGARAVGGKPVAMVDVDLMNIPSYMVNGDSAEKMIAQVEQAIETNGWLVFLFHGVGGEHDINVGKEQHQKLLDYLAKHSKDLWVAPVEEVTEFVSAHTKHH